MHFDAINFGASCQCCGGLSPSTVPSRRAERGIRGDTWSREVSEDIYT